MRRLLWIGDAGVHSGFARVTHGVLDVLARTWDVHVLGINYRGDPHDYPYPIYPAASGGDSLGVGRTAELVERLGPDCVCLLNDPWNVPAYRQRAGDTPVVAFLAVDGKNCRGAEWLSGLALAVFWTQFGLHEARQGGYAGPAAVVPLGVDVDVYQPGDREAARARLGLDRVFTHRGLPRDTFIVGTVNRNQTRKRFDLLVQYFAEWVKSRGITDAALYVHSAPTGDEAYTLSQLAQYYGIANRLIEPRLTNRNGATEAAMAATYPVFDVLLSTSQNEGWSLPTMEAMACGIPCVVPKWAALSEWPEDAAITVPCSTTSCTPHQINVIGGIPDRQATIAALDRLYRDRALRADYAGRGRALVSRPQYRWPAIGAAFTEALETALYPQAVQLGERTRVAAVAG